MKLPVATFFFLLSCYFLHAQRSQDWLSHNDRGNRYEGTYTRKVSNPSIDLVSLTGYFEPYEFGKQQVLNVRFSSPGEASCQLRAEELLITQFYWMQSKETQAKEGWNQLGEWPVDFFLKRFSINARNLGILIPYRSETGVRFFLPAFVFNTTSPSEIARYILQFRLGRAVRKGTYKVYKGEIRSSQNLLSEGQISAKSGGAIFPIVLSIDNFTGYQGWISVEVNLQEEGTMDPFSYSFQFYHPKL